VLFEDLPVSFTKYTARGRPPVSREVLLKGLIYRDLRRILIGYPGKSKKWLYPNLSKAITREKCCIIGHRPDLICTDFRANPYTHLFCSLLARWRSYPQPHPPATKGRGRIYG
jgi:hypothetical protein